MGTESLVSNTDITLFSDLMVPNESQSKEQTISLLKEFNFPIIKSPEKKKKKIKKVPMKEEKKEDK